MFFIQLGIQLAMSLITYRSYIDFQLGLKISVFPLVSVISTLNFLVYPKVLTENILTRNVKVDILAYMVNVKMFKKKTKMPLYQLIFVRLSADTHTYFCIWPYI